MKLSDARFAAVAGMVCPAGDDDRHFAAPISKLNGTSTAAGWLVEIE